MRSSGVENIKRDVYDDEDTEKHYPRNAMDNRAVFADKELV